MTYQTLLKSLEFQKYNKRNPKLCPSAEAEFGKVKLSGVRLKTKQMVQTREQKLVSTDG